MMSKKALVPSPSSTQAPAYDTFTPPTPRLTAKPYGSHDSPIPSNTHDRRYRTLNLPADRNAPIRRCRPYGW